MYNMMSVGANSEKIVNNINKNIQRAGQLVERVRVRGKRSGEQYYSLTYIMTMPDECMYTYMIMLLALYV